MTGCCAARSGPVGSKFLLYSLRRNLAAFLLASTFSMAGFTTCELWRFGVGVKGGLCVCVGIKKEVARAPRWMH